MSLPIFAFSSTGEEVANAFAQEIQGKNVLITGTSVGGIGFETARVIAKHANLIIITGYDSDRLKISEDAIKKETPSANIRRLVLDLSSLAEVRKAAAEVNTYPEPLHVLINNAAAPIGPFKLTVDNLESQTATDYIGPFLFTKLLAPKLLAASTGSYVPRVVFLSSYGHALMPELDLNKIVGKPDEAKYHPFYAYAHMKAASVLIAIELSKRSGGRINGYSLCPGQVYTNMHQREGSIELFQQIGLLDTDGRPSTEKFDAWKTIPQGAATMVVAAFDPRLNDHPGAYLSNGAEANKERAAYSSDPANAEKLWIQTEEIIGEKFTF
ncbi:hypothetical protein B0H14DRAFT_1218560 [Mycena olivaceomarginata]|nr:hypothetical protein B0H14DRAFT_1218560 [Mycena olivaceomarginata]